VPLPSALLPRPLRRTAVFKEIGYFSKFVSYVGTTVFPNGLAMDENCPATVRSAITTGTSIAGRIGVARNESPA
jgi:hypothetical protein